MDMEMQDMGQRVSHKPPTRIQKGLAAIDSIPCLPNTMSPVSKAIFLACLLFGCVVIVGVVLGLIPIYIQQASQSGVSSLSVAGNQNGQASSSSGRSVTVTFNGVSQSVNNLPNFESYADNLLQTCLSGFTLNFAWQYAFANSALSTQVYMSAYSSSMVASPSQILSCYCTFFNTQIASAPVTDFKNSTGVAFSTLGTVGLGLSGTTSVPNGGGLYSQTTYSSCVYTCSGGATPTNSSCITTSTATSSSVVTPMVPTTASGSSSASATGSAIG